MGPQRGPQAHRSRPYTPGRGSGAGAGSEAVMSNLVGYARVPKRE